MDRSTTDRPARSGAELLLAAATVAALAYAGVTLGEALVSDTLSTPTSLALDPDQYVGPLPEAVEIDSLTGLVDTEAGIGHRLLWWLVTGSRGLLLGLGLELLRRLATTMNAPFTSANVSRLRLIAGLAVAYQLIELVRGPVDVIITAGVGFGEIATAERLGAPLVVAAFAAVLAQVWDAGVRLRSEHSLTI